MFENILTKKDLIKNLQEISQKDILNIESNDLQYKSLENLFSNIEKNDNFFVTKILSLVIINSIICYQLSNSWEFYWEEFCNYCIQNIKNIKQYQSSKDFLSFFIWFFKITKGNKRLQEIKIKRIIKSFQFIDKLLLSENIIKEYYLNNQIWFIQEFAKVMNQKITDKTIVFTLKLFNFSCRIIYWKIVLFPKEMIIPIDSRIKKISEKIKQRNESDIEFWMDISNNLSFSLLHYDSYLWWKKTEN